MLGATIIASATPRLCASGRWRQGMALAVRDVDVLTAEPARGGRVDIRIDLMATYDSPFDQDEIAVDALVRAPSGIEVAVPAFFYQRFERRITGSHYGRNQEVVVASGPPEWRVRLTPAEAGRHEVAVRARDRSGTVTSSSVVFTAAPARFRGWIRVSRDDPRYFAFDDGTPYFAVGMNLAEGPIAEYYRWIPRLAKSGGNFARVWAGHPNFALEVGRVGEYRLDGAWRLDQILELAEAHGVRLKLCLDWVCHITPRGEARDGGTDAGWQKMNLEDYAYAEGNGGPCRNMRDFFTLPEARRRFKNRLRYTVARWGYSPSVMAWELWNEIDCVDRAVGGKTTILPWNREMCHYLKSVDPWRHLTTDSLGSTCLWEEMWRMPENDLAQMHGYYYFSPHAREDAKDMAGFILKWLDPIAGFGKPYLFSEYGLVPDVPEIRALKDADPSGVHLHNGLWAPLAHGAAGTGHAWYWGQYIDPKDLYYHFQAVARFVEGIPWTTAGFARAKVTSSRDGLRVVGLRGKPLSLLWLQNKAHTWWNAAHGVEIAPIRDAAIALGHMPDGDCHVEFWDTYTGRIASTIGARAAGGALCIPVPAVERDLALKITPLRRE